MNVIKIRGLEISACHGVKDFEKIQPQPFIFDADLYVDFYAAAKSDDIEKTVNYSRVCKLLSEITSGNCFNLIEKLVYECAFAVMDKFPAVEKLYLTVNKPQAPMKRKFESVAAGVCLERQTAYLSLGSSMGDRQKTLDTAVQKLDLTRGITVEKVSDYIKTEPYGGVAKNEFLNAAVRISTYLTPFNLLDEIHRIEAEAGRVRNKRWEDRTLDIDIIFYGDKKINTPRLTVPHAEYKKRDFVLIPLRQVCPELSKYE